MTKSAGYFQYYNAGGRSTKILGMDISTAGAQYPVDFAVAYAYGVKFVIMKTGNGITTDDANFLTANIADARSAGLKVGTYHFSAPKVTGWSVSASQSEANKYCDRLIAQFPSGDTGDLMPCLDMESDTVLTGVTTAEVKAWIIAFMDQVKLRIGRQCILYTNYYSMDYTFPDPIIADMGAICPLWLASRAPDLVYNQPPSTYPNYNFTAFGNFPGELWDMWQYSSDGNGLGADFGVNSTDIDTDILEGDLYTLMRPTTIATVVASPGDNKITITWVAGPDPDILNYNLYLNDIKVATNVTSPYIKTSLINGSNYKIQITAQDKWEESALSTAIYSSPKSPVILSSRSENIWIFDYAEKLISIVDITKVRSAHQIEKITGESSFEISLPNNLDDSVNAVVGNYFGFYDLDNEFCMYEILSVEETEAQEGITKLCKCENVYYELRDNIIEDLTAEQSNSILAVDQALTNSRWSIGDIDAFGIHTQNFWYESSLSCIDKIRQRWTYYDVNGRIQQGIFKYHLTLTGNVITGRTVDFKRQIGAYTGKRAVIGKDLLAIKRTVDNSSLITGAYGQGKGEEITTDNTGVLLDMDQEGVKSYNKRITFANATWTNDFPLITNTGFETGLSPNWIEITGASYGTTTVDTSRYYRGTTSIKMVDTGALYPSTILSDTLYAVSPGQVIYSTLWVNSPSLLSDGTYKGINITVYYFNGAVATGTFNSLQLNPLVANRWEQLSLTTTIPATGVTGVKFGIATNSNINEPGTAYFDEFHTSYPANKPYALTYVSDPIALALYGRAGGTLNRWGMFEDEEEQNPWILLQKTWDYIQLNNTPIIEYEAEILDLEKLLNYSHEKMRLGDLIYLLDENFNVPIEVTARIIELDRDLLLSENTKVILGNFMQDASDINKRQADLEKKVLARQTVWDRGSAFETAVEGTRMRMITKDGELQSVIKYEDDNIPPNLIGYFSPEEFNYKRVRSDEFIGQNIVTVFNAPVEYYINSYSGDDLNTGLVGHPYKTLSRLLSSGTIPKVMLWDIIVYVSDSNPGGAGTSPYNEDVEFKGISGSGMLRINFGTNVRLNGSLTFSGCEAYIYLHGNSATNMGYVFTTDTNMPLRVNNCMHLFTRYMWYNANDSAQYAVLGVASHVSVIACIAEHSTVGGIASTNGGNIYIDGCKGSYNAQYGIISASASHVGTVTSIPDGAVADILPMSGGLIVPSAQTGETQTNGVASPGVIGAPTAQATQTSYASFTSSWRFNYKSYRTDNTLVYQGSWGYGNHIGLMYFNGVTTFADIATSANTIKSAILYIKRSSSAGYSSAQLVWIWGHDRTTQPYQWDNNYLMGNYGYIASLKWGEIIGITMPAQFLLDVKSGITKGLALYTTGDIPYLTLLGVDEYSIRVVFKYD
jgi:phage minor structural protein